MSEASGEQAKVGGEAGGDGNKTPKPLTEEDVGRIVNSAVTAQLKRSLPQAVTEAVTGLKLDEQIGAAVAKLQSPKLEPPAGGEGDDGGSGRVTTKDLQKQITTLSEKLEASEKKATAADQQRVEIEQRVRFDRGLTAFRSGVQQHVKSDLLDVFVEHHGRTKGRLKVDENGNATLTVKKPPYKGAPPVDEDLPLAEAIPLLLASEEAKPFLPAPGGHQEKQPKGRQQLQALSSGAPADPYSTAVAALEKAGLSDALD